jgi:hypothetical protein
VDVGIDASERNLDSFLRNEIFKLWQNSVVIFENSYLPHITSVLDAIGSVNRSLSKESIKIEFASIGHLYLQLFKLEWPKVNIGRF